ncbi:AIPR family protein [Amycolatopsis sp. YIM 10]|uniref:AIPR family protein n=1 Tax=Amycolatopsis sp. YIM 10 TaxID=2653857 RepID=UPI0012AA9E96|nr:AIPR family protein [Amycolatopsis sp. YIM 10]QFU89519.1 AIPR protein [Amycolatopsis sp. YIM 10]
MTDGELAAFAAELRRRVEDRVQAEPELMARDAFVTLVGEHLIDDGALDDLETCYLFVPWQSRRVEVAGYDITGDGTILHLVTADYGLDVEPLKRERLTQLVRRVGAFADFCRNGLHEQLERSSPAYDMVEHIHNAWPHLQMIKIFVFTDGKTGLRRAEEATVAGLPTLVNVWDVNRLHKLISSGAHQEDIVIDVAKMGYEVPCLESPEQADGYHCLMAMLPGKLLADLYDEHHSRLLQRNVRAYLQARGKVNKGIAETIKEQPGRFLAYNNGVSATARAADLERTPSGLVLRTLTELQIVNGGQTTASLHHAARKGIDLAQVIVPAKITLIPDDRLDSMVPEISRYANSQNAVTPADFEGNSRFHVGLERWSRTIWVNPLGVDVEQTRWYYERVRGQYDVEKNRFTTAATRRKFDRENPVRQRFGKTDAAKYEYAYSLRPENVCQGAEKCFRTWTSDEGLAEREAPDDVYFRHLVAKAIVFRQVRSVIQKQNFGGYLGQTAAHTVSLIVHTLGGLDLDRLWREQTLPEAIVTAVPDVAKAVRRVLTSPPSGGNVTEWAKKTACWDRVRAMGWAPPSNVLVG